MLDIKYDAILFNDDSYDVNFTIESDNSATAFIIDGGTGIPTMSQAYGHDMNGETIRDLQINNSGELGYDSSTRRAKMNIEDMGDESDLLYQLRPVVYESRKRQKILVKEPKKAISQNDSSKVEPEKYVESWEYTDEGFGNKRYGLIAEEVNEINPAFVWHNEDGIPDGVNYKELVSVLINEIQRLEKRVAALEAEVFK